MSETRQKKGAGLELEAAAYFQSYGYLVRRGINMYVGSGTAEVTDIDVLAIRFGVPLAEERLIADCKDRKKPQTFERVLWVKGLASFSGADRCVVVTPRARWQVREFASQGHVEVLEADRIQERLAAGEKPTEPFGEASPEISQLLELNRRRLKNPKDKELIGADSEARKMLVSGHPLTNFNRLISILSKIGDPSAGFTRDSEWMRRYVLCDLTVIASLMLVRFAAESKWTPESDWSDYARKRLTFGDLTPQKVRDLTKLALDHDFFELLPSPGYSDEIVALLKALIEDQDSAAIVPNAVDFLLLGKALGGASANDASSLFGDRQERAFKVSKRVLSAIAYAAGMPTGTYESDVR